MNWLGRLDVVVLAILLTYAVFTFIRACRLVQGAARDDRAIAQPNVELKMRVRTLKSIAFVSPYLGLVGTCVGIMSAFTGIGMEKHAALAMMASRVAASLVTTGAGIIVAVSAICLSHLIRTHLAYFREEVATKRLPLGKRLSELPAFALIAAPALGLSVVPFMAFSSLHGPTGFDVRLPSARCAFRGDERITVLRITDAGTLFINAEQENWKGLGGRLSTIYGTRSHRTLYLSAEDRVPFQNVADAIDIATNAVVAGTSKPLHVTVGLMTPAVLKSHCPELR